MSIGSIRKPATSPPSFAIACARTASPFHPTRRTLYVSDTGASHKAGHPKSITAYTVSTDGRSVANPRTFAVCDAGFFDGFRCDVHGNVWTSTGEGVRCYAPDGTHFGTIRIPELVANLCFGGPKRNRLYIAGQTSLYAYFVATKGAELPTPAA